MMDSSIQAMPIAAESAIVEESAIAAVRAAPTDFAADAAVESASYVPAVLETTMHTPDLWLLLFSLLALAGVIVSIAYLIIQKKRLQKLLLEEK
jgi:hypothetical protein